MSEELVKRLRFGANMGTVPKSVLGDFGILDEAADRIEALESALRTIQGEAERGQGNWTHLKRCIGVHARQALAPTPKG